jgi:hypothetical protein
MRNEDDLRAALVALEQCAPAAERVLPGARAKRRRRVRLWSGQPWWPTRSMLLGTGAIAAGVAVALVVTLTGPVGTSRQSGPHVAVGSPVDASLLSAILTGNASVAGDIMYTSSTVDDGQHSGLFQKDWWYPWLAVPGQRVTERSLFMTQPGGGPLQDVTEMYTLPRTNSIPACSPTTQVNYNTRTWSVGNEPTVIDTSYPLYNMRATLKKGGWVVAGYGELDGQRVITLRRNLDGSNLLFSVNVKTYVPVQYAVSDKSAKISSVTTYLFLAPTSANLAQLKSPVPAGFRRVPAKC